MGRIAVTGSIAFDTIMVFPGRFGEHILPDKTHQISVSFLVDNLVRQRGGTAANIAYTLALLGEHPLLCGAVGHDFGDYDRALTEAGVDTSTALRCDDIPTAAAYITTDQADNQITAFHPGAMGRAAAIDLGVVTDVEVVVISPDAPDAMRVHTEQAVAGGHRLVFAPAQQLPSLPDETLVAGLDAAWLIAGNDYELELIRSRTGRSVDDLRARGAMVALTLGGDGSTIHSAAGVETIPVASIASLTDPTGAGDAYVAGLLAGLRRGLAIPVAGRMGALAAAYAVERSGPQGHGFTAADFAGRYRSAFGEDLPVS